jgi:ribosome-associated translation inhibitor RaiA
MRTQQQVALPAPRTVVRGEFGIDVAELVAGKLSPVARHAHGPVLDVHVRLTREARPVDGRPVSVEVDLDVNGRPVRAEASARSARDALDLVVNRLIRQLDQYTAARRRRVTRH